MLRVLTLSVLCVATVVNAAHQNIHNALMAKIDETTYGNEDPMFYIQGLRGFYNGIEDGIHKSKKAGDICFDKTAQEDLIHVIEAVMDKDIS